MRTVFNRHKVAELLWNAPERTGQPLKDIADHSGLGYKHLSRMLHPQDDGAKLGWEEFVYLLAVTDLEPLDEIERVFGRVAFEIPDVDGIPFEELMDTTGETIQVLGSFIQDVCAAREKGAGPHNYQEDVGIELIDKAIAGLARLRATLAQPPEPKP